MNLFFRNLIISFHLVVVVLFLHVGIAQAVVIYGIHLSSCQRELGIILHVEPLELTFLTLGGNIKKIKQYEVINVSYYNSSYLPLAETTQVNEIPSYVIKTRRGNEIVKLLQGWPVEFTNDKISFISSDGSDILIDRDNIWDINEELEDSKIERSAIANTSFQFYPPYQYRECNFNETFPFKNGAKTIYLYPQQTLSEPITIKKEFDRLYAGYDTIHKYVREKKFYGIPQNYTNLATLGLWLNSGSRYGSSSSRTGNLLPFIVNEKSEGPYSYQHQMVTGIAPIPKSTHEEPQTQISYEFKASYFHLMTMVDPNIVLVGSNYKWKGTDLKNNDIKYNDKFIFEFGFDYNAFAVGFRRYTLGYGVLYDDTFSGEDVYLSGTSITFINHLYRADLTFGSSDSNLNLKEVYRHNIRSMIETSFDIKFLRFNLDITTSNKWLYSYSFISKTSNFGNFIKADSVSNVLYLNYKYGPRYLIGAFAAIETLSVSSVTSAKKSVIYPKLGASFSLKF